ncbi:MAG: hypothetical protein M3290_02745 [Actinomycetota bacterium]|nr:hypothetical protein [Actinomycetota bacterium]
MSVLVTVETVLVILMLVLVAGLLRSHAEILRRLEMTVARPPSNGPDITPRRDPGAPAPDISGETPDRGSLGLSMIGADTLVAFLSSGCTTCRGFWDALKAGTATGLHDVRLVIVTRDASLESPTKIEELAPRDIPVVMSSTAWDDYEVPMSPYFVLVNGATGTIAGEGTAQTWPQVLSLVRDALADERHAAPGGPSAEPENRPGRADTELLAAGIGPDHPSLYEPDDPALLKDLDVVD